MRKNAKSALIAFAGNAGPDKPAHPRNLIRAFADRLENHCILFFRIQRRKQAVVIGPRGYKLFSCSTQLSMKFSLLIDMKMRTIVGIFISISREKNHAQLCYC